MTYDDVIALVNDSFKRTNDIRLTMKETGQPFSIVYEALGFKDYDNFVLDNGE